MNTWLVVEMDGRTDGWMGGWMNGYLDRYANVHTERERTRDVDLDIYESACTALHYITYLGLQVVMIVPLVSPCQ